MSHKQKSFPAIDCKSETHLQSSCGLVAYIYIYTCIQIQITFRPKQIPPAAMLRVGRVHLALVPRCKHLRVTSHTSDEGRKVHPTTTSLDGCTWLAAGHASTVSRFQQTGSDDESELFITSTSARICEARTECASNPAPAFPK